MIFHEKGAGQIGGLLRGSPLFSQLPPEELAAVAREVRQFHLPGGEYLFRQGDSADGLYLLVRGRLRVSVSDDEDRQNVVGEVAPGETVGEMAMLTDESRSASVRAIRDSELLQLSRGAFDRLMGRSPGAMLQLGRLIVRRHQGNLRRRSMRLQVRTIALFPATAGDDVFAFTEWFAHALGEHGRVEVIRPPAADFQDEHLPDLYERIQRAESDCDFMLFPCTTEPDRWTRFALAEADRILILCRGDGHTDKIGDRASVLRGTFARREVVVRHARHVRPSGTARWCLAFATQDRHHVVDGDRAGIDRLARLITGRGNGLVLGGGGARGFCHVGLLKALELHGVPIDHVGGTSMGGILATQVASGRSADELREWILRLRRDGLLRNDYTLPIYSVVAGRHFASIFQGWVGDLEMEDLWIDCFCISANLSRARQEVHRSGKVRHVARATGALPGLLPPMHLDGDVLVDGGVLNNVPVDVMIGLERGRVIASRVLPRSGLTASLGPDEIVSGWSLFLRRFLPGFARPALPSIAEIIVRSSFLGATVNQAATAGLADLLIDFDFPQFGLLEWEKAERIIAESTDAAMATVERWCREQPELSQRGGPE